MTTMTKDHTYVAGKIDYEGKGKRNLVEFEWTLEGGRFSMSASIWDARHYDILAGGQMVEEAASYFPDDPKVQRMLAIWREWHLNDMHAGSPAQEAWLKANPIEYTYPESHYEVASAKLAEAGLNPDTSFVRPDDLSRNVKTDGGYRYGSAWLRRELPAEVIAEIESWG